ncbi:hypothetical protein [Burkholderia multivorans]|uniref:hypothetical protein n=2 Tax=Burkholderia multivorans TaxID=87883 RepID=UPI0028702C6D|nr:hypothetical protein [Burkholderia multivorans]
MTKDMLLPLPTGKVRALSLENQLALGTGRTSRGDLDQGCCLLHAAYLAFYLREATSAGADFDLHQRAEAALNAGVTRAEQGGHCLLVDHELATIERIWSSTASSWSLSRRIAIWVPGNDCHTAFWPASARRSRPHRVPDGSNGKVCVRF